MAVETEANPKFLLNEGISHLTETLPSADRIR